MAYYELTVTIPPNTPEYRPVEFVMQPLQPMVKNVSILFPGGSLGLVGINLSEDNRQFAPTPSGWIRDNNQTVSIPVNRKLQGPPYRVVIRGYSLASDWSHSVSIRMECG